MKNVGSISHWHVWLGRPAQKKSLIRAAAVFFPRANSFKAVKDAVIRLGHQNRSSWGLEIRSRDEHSATWARSKTLKFPLKLNEEPVIAVKEKRSNHWESPKAFRAPPEMMLAAKQGSVCWITESDNRAQLLQGLQLGQLLEHLTLWLPERQILIEISPHSWVVLLPG